jgi:hypothetical protein
MHRWHQQNPEYTRHIVNPTRNESLIEFHKMVTRPNTLVQIIKDGTGTTIKSNDSKLKMSCIKDLSGIKQILETYTPTMNLKSPSGQKITMYLSKNPDYNKISLKIEQGRINGLTD